MSRIVIIKREDGRLHGLDDKHERQYQKFRRIVAAMEIGQTAGFSFRLPRSPRHHALFFHKLHSLLERTEEFSSLDMLRYWVVLGAGYADFVPGLDGRPNAIPRSIDFDSLDEADFCELHRAVDQFLWTARAQQTLWPQLDAERRYQCMESFMEEFR